MLSSSINYQKGIYANSRQIDARLTFILDGNTNVYDDNTITQMSIVEEMSVLNDAIPSDEVQITLDNTDGTFDFLNMSNMFQIIAKRPKLQVELGLVLPGSSTWASFGVKKWSEI